MACPTQVGVSKTFLWNQQKAKIIQEEMDSILEKEAKKLFPHNQAIFVSNFFLVKKKPRRFRPVITLQNLNQFVHTEHFTMETTANLRTMLSKDDWIVTIDIADAYLTIPMAEEFKDYAAFQYQDQTYHFLCMSFGLNDTARAFTNNEAYGSQSKSSRIQGSSLFRRLDSSCPNKAFMFKTIPVFSKLSLETRFQNKLRKIQSDSISGKRMVRFYHQFKRHDNFATTEKNRQPEKESPGSQKQNKSP